MVGASAVGLITFSGVARLKYQVAILNRHPDMLARIAIAPLEKKSILVLVEATLPIEVVAVEHVQDLSHPAGVDDALGLWRQVRCRFLRQILWWDLQCTRGMLLFADHLLDHLALFLAQAVTLPENWRSALIAYIFWSSILVGHAGNSSAVCT